MKKYDSEDLRVISLLKKKAEENPDKIEISWIRSSRFPRDLGKVTQREYYDDSGESLAVQFPFPQIQYKTEEGFKKPEDVIREVEKLKCHYISANINVLKFIDEKTLIAKLFDRFFLIELEYPFRSSKEPGLYQFTIYDYLFNNPFTFYELDRKEALAMML